VAPEKLNIRRAVRRLDPDDVLDNLGKRLIVWIDRNRHGRLLRTMSGGAGQTPGEQDNVGLILAVTSKMVFVAPHAIDYALAPSVHALDIGRRAERLRLLLQEAGALRTF